MLPHLGSLVESNVINNAAILNQPPLSFAGLKARKLEMPCVLDSDDISMEVVKKAEKEDCLVVRLVETKGRRSKGTMRFNRPVEKVVVSNMIEWEDNGCVELEGQTAEVSLKPFEIATYKVY